MKKFTPTAKTGQGNSPSPETAERDRVAELLKPQGKTAVKSVAATPQKNKEVK